MFSYRLLKDTILFRPPDIIDCPVENRQRSNTPWPSKPHPFSFEDVVSISTNPSYPPPLLSWQERLSDVFLVKVWIEVCIKGSTYSTFFSYSGRIRGNFFFPFQGGSVGIIFHYRGIRRINFSHYRGIRWNHFSHTGGSVGIILSIQGEPSESFSHYRGIRWNHFSHSGRIRRNHFFITGGTVGLIFPITEGSVGIIFPIQGDPLESFFPYRGIRRNHSFHSGGTVGIIFALQCDPLESFFPFREDLSE